MPPVSAQCQPTCTNAHLCYRLRPKVDNYQLSVASGMGHNLNCSLFERLVLGGFPHATLGTQHRMHPNISSLIKHTYPALQDHSGLLEREPVKVGLCRWAVGLRSDLTSQLHDGSERASAQQVRCSCVARRC